MQACAAPVARNSAAIPVRRSFLRMDCPAVAKLCWLERDDIAGHMTFIRVKVYFMAAVGVSEVVAVSGG